MTHERIQEVMNEARLRYEALASMSDAIALLDLCHSFADNVASSNFPWCRPILTEFNNVSVTAPCEQNVSCGGGALIIKNGRFAIDVQANLPPKQGNSRNEVTGGFIPNDTYASAYQNFTVITGVNGSGKTFYLKQIAIIVILAHCGSYVPADEAFIPIRDKIFTRLGNSDDQEHNISSFLQEMKESAFICNNVTDRSLVLIDELGRATSNEDGVAIAWAIAEYLLLKRATTFFVTHYPQLCKLSEVYPNVQNQHLGILPTDDLRDISYTHKLLPGPCTSSADYGIKMCAMCGWDQGVVFEASIDIDAFYLQSTFTSMY
jgi:DNA mismatch repair protein MSH4